MGHLSTSTPAVQGENRAALRASLRKVTESRRERQCGVCGVRDAGPAIEANGKPGAWDTRWIGVLTCGHIWTCPVCSARLRALRIAKLVRAMGNAGGVWQMVTLTVRHRRGMPLAALRRGVSNAWRRARQGGSTQRIWRENVSASARAVDITHGKNGWHVHLHVLLRTDGFSEENRTELLERWKRAVLEKLGPECVPEDEHAIRWSTPINACEATELERAAYLAKLGAELVGGDTKTRTKKGSRTPWHLLRDAGAGEAEALALWLEFSAGVKGARAIELDDRAARFAKKDLPSPLDVNLATPVEGEARERVTIPVDALELRALRQYEQRYDPAVLSVILNDVAKSERPAAVVRTWLDFVTERLSATPLPMFGYTPRNAREEETPRALGRGPPFGPVEAAT